MKHDDVFYYEFQPPDKRRPVVILTRTSAILCLHSVTIAPITSIIRGIPTEEDADGKPIANNYVVTAYMKEVG